jgi:Ni,Fe-hydrogenase I cytochrome b subunit
VFGVQDQNRILLSVTSFLFYLMATRLDRPLMLGGLLAIVWAAEPVLIVTAPVLLPVLLTDSSTLWRAKGTRGRAFVRLATGFLVVGFPFMFRMMLVSGSPLGHEHFSYNPTQEYSFLGIPFTLNAYLNWPFHDHLVRSPYNAVPNLALVPLMVLRHLGLVLAAVALYGFGVLVARKRYRLFGALSAWFALMAGSLAVLENWTQVNKWDIVLMAYGPLFIASGFGIDSLAGPRKGRFGRFAVLAGLVGVLAAGQRALASVEAPVDSRLVEDSGRWNDPGALEKPEYMDFERRTVRDIALWPRKSLEGRLDVDQLRANLAAALRDLPHTDVADWHLSASEALLLVVMDQKDYPVPTGFDLEAVKREARTLPESFTLDLRVPPSAGLDGNDPEVIVRPPCVGPTTHLYPYDDFLSMKVDWNPVPIQIGFYVGDGHGFGMLVILRQRYDLDREVAAEPGCLTLHVPPGTTVDLFDNVSNDPSRLYLYSLRSPEGPSGGVRLTPRF